MYLKNLKAKFITIIALGSIFIFSGCSASTEQSKSIATETKNSEMIQNEKEKISQKTETIQSETDNDTKLSDYKQLINESNSYAKSEKNDKKVVQFYDDSIIKIKTNFKKHDEKVLKENQSDHVDQESKNKLIQKTNTLTDLKKWIQKENTDVYKKDEFTAITTKIDKLVLTYQAQSKKIADAEKAAAQKAAAEKAAAEQAAAQQAAAEKAAAEQAAAQKAVVQSTKTQNQESVSSQGYKRDARGRWHRPNGQYASKVEIAKAGLAW